MLVVGCGIGYDKRDKVVVEINIIIHLRINLWEHEQMNIKVKSSLR